jgi:hypothetical protein
VNSDLAKKLVLEAELAASINKIYDRMSDTGSFLYVSSGRPISGSPFQPDFEKALSDHYKKTFNVFDNPFGGADLDSVAAKNAESKAEPEQNVATPISLSPEPVDASKKPYEQTVASRQKAFIDQQAPQQSHTIADTAAKRWNDILAASLGLYLTGKLTPAAQDENSPMAQDITVAKATKDSFNAQNPGASDRVGLTETQHAAESNKFYIASATAALISKKIWITILDGRARSSHSLAFGQKRSMFRPFIVQNQQLMYPRDMSMGATLDNIVNCRCGVAYTLP